MLRQPAVAGYFYPAEKDVLLKQVAQFLPAKKEKLKAKAIVVPHAGYMYSGHVAGEVYASIELPETFIILCPNHTGVGSDFDISPANEWVTPLGSARVDQELLHLLMEQFPRAILDGRAHLKEHSLEVQLPFLQYLKKDFRFVPLCVGQFQYEHLEELGHALAFVIRSYGGNVLMISSSDMTHYESQESAGNKDRLAIEQMKRVNARGLYDTVHQHDISMCGILPTTATLVACHDLNASQGVLLKYATSGDVTGDYNQVVGYAGIAIL